MFYRCRACDEEVERGWLPSATRGLYGCFLVGLVLGVVYPVAWCVRRSLPPPPAEPLPPDPWWVTVLAVGGGLFVVLVLASLINFLLESAEYLVVRRKPCPECGAKRWSWGYTRGFGL